MNAAEELYDDSHIAFLERMWGEGFLSPGGPDEVARVLEGLDLTGSTIVDIGCGAGGITALLARDYGAAKVIGLDVEASTCTAAQALAERWGVADRVEIRQVTLGPMPLPDGSVDLVFSKDSIIHIADKHALATDAFRVLRPGGWFAASDWLISHDGDPSPEMAAYIAAEDLDFQMASPARYQAALEAAGFQDIRLVNRNPWYREVAKAERDRLTGPERAEFEKLLPDGDLEGQITTWQAMIGVLESGEHCPHHLRGRKP
ncbi:MAG: methyltransferase domain-containing protein [Pseudomonadota bacterium]